MMRPYRASDRDSLDRLWRQYFSPWSANHFWTRRRWQFDENPFAEEREPINLVLTADDEVVGHMGSIPMPIRLGGNRAVALCGTAFVVDSRYRLQAFRLFRTMAAESKPIMGSSMSDASRAFFLRFGGRMIPSSREHFVMHLRQNGQACIALRGRLRRPLVKAVQPWMLGPIARLVVGPRATATATVPPRGRDDGSIRRLDGFGAPYAALWARFCERVLNSLDKTPEYMTWRYLQCPSFEPLCFGRHDASGALIGLVLVMRRAERDWTGGVGAVHGEIAELIVADPEDATTARMLLLAGMHALDGMRVDTITATGLDAAFHGTLEALGFSRTQSDEFALGLLLEADAREATDVVTGPGWYTTAGDGDTIFSVSI